MADDNVMNRSSCAIVGGGIAGLYSAIRIKRLNPTQPVLLLDQSTELGGLLRSECYNGAYFDYGAHVPRETGESAVDDILFGELDGAAWRSFRNINAGNVSHAGELYSKSPFPYLGNQSPVLASTQLEQLKTLEDQPGRAPSNLSEDLMSKFGNSLCEHFFSPVFEKFFGLPMSQLEVGCDRLLGLSKVILGNAQSMRELKLNPRLDHLLAFADQTQGLSSLLNYYPSNGRGIGQWIAQLATAAEQLGVDIRLATNIQQIECDSGRVEAIVIDTDQRVEIDHLVWTGPSAALANLTGCEVPPAIVKPEFRKTLLFHMAFSEAFLTENTFVNVFDPSFHTFRVTIYPNLSGQSSSPFCCTVEVMVAQDQTVDQDTILAELVKMGIIGDADTLRFSKVDVVFAGFPVPRIGYFHQVEALSGALRDQLENICLLGKASGKHFFMRDVLLHAETKLVEQFG